MPNQHNGFIWRVEHLPHIADIDAQVGERRWVGTRARQLIHDSYPVTSILQLLGHVVPHPGPVEPAMD